MKNALLAILLCGVAVAACNADREAKVEAEQRTAIALESSANNSGAAGVDIKADMESGEVELKLPGGLQGKVTIPDGLGSDAKFDLDGVGRYPGARLTSVNVQASGKDDDGKGQVVLGFTAPGRAGQVTDWYEKALASKGRPASRSGNSLTSATEDGDRMLIAIEDGEGEVARGRIIITDRAG